MLWQKILVDLRKGEVIMNDLKHIGVLGMKWGVRKRGPASSDHVRSREIRKKHLSEMSNEEIRTVVNRLQLERAYKDVDYDTMSRGQKMVKQLMTKIGGFLINSYVRQKAGPDFSGYEAFAQAVRNKGKGG